MPSCIFMRAAIAILALIVSGDYSIMIVLTIVISNTWRGCRRIKSSDGDDKNGERMCLVY
jgi:hypothetical protein